MDVLFPEASPFPVSPLTAPSPDVGSIFGPSGSATSRRLAVPAGSQPSADDLIAAMDAPLRQNIQGKNERVVGTSGNDRLDASKGKGGNTLIGKAGNDRLKGRRKDTLKGGGGNDRLDTRRGRNNTLRGGGGSDVLFAGRRDKVFGNGGADRLDASKGKGRNTLNGGGGADLLIGNTGDRLIGGRGADEFLIANGKLPAQPLIIKDFKQGSDRLTLQNIPAIQQLSDVEQIQQGNNLALGIQGQTVAILENVGSIQLTSNDINGITGSTPGTPTPPTPTVSVSDKTVVEGNPGDSSAVVFTVQLSQASTEAVTITYETVDGEGVQGAIANTDYTPVQGTITVPAGSTTQSITVPIIGDFVDEDDESFRLKLLSVSSGNAVIGDGEAIALIIDDENETITTQTSNQYSQTGTDETEVQSQFNLTQTTADGNAILDTLTTNPNEGLFIGAVQNFQFGNGSLTNTADETVANFNPDNNTTLSSANLRARFIDNPEPDADVIEYSILPPNSSNSVLDITYDIERVFGAPVPPDELDVNQAINALDYIVENDLLNRRGTIFIENFGFASVIGTRKVKQYTRNRTNLAGETSIFESFTLVDRTPSGTNASDTPSAFIEDAISNPNQGMFMGAIEEYFNADTNEMIAIANLKTQANGTVVSYEISVGNGVLTTATLDLSTTSFDIDRAVNEVDYILENDLLSVAFTP